MKIISRTAILFFLVALVSACNSTMAPTPAMGQENIMETAISVAQQEVAMTLTAVPTVTFAFPTPSPVPPEPTKIPPDAYADKIDHAMTIAPTVYERLPFIKQTAPYGEYSGCIYTYDFHNFVVYSVVNSMDAVNAAFLRYFLAEAWEFKEPLTETISWNDKSIPRITYDVFRITSKNSPSFERLKVILTDESAVRGKAHIDVRAEFNHVEAKENLKYLIDPLACYNRQESWFWIGLHK